MESIMAGLPCRELLCILTTIPLRMSWEGTILINIENYPYKIAAHLILIAFHNLKNDKHIIWVNVLMRREYMMEGKIKLKTKKDKKRKEIKLYK